MDLQQIKYFLAVVDCGTFLAASRQVYVSQPTLSAGIRKLEESLNVTLFHRGSRAASLTAAGERFLGPARQAYNQLQAIKGELVDQAGQHCHRRAQQYPHGSRCQDHRPLPGEPSPYPA